MIENGLMMLKANKLGNYVNKNNLTLIVILLAVASILIIICLGKSGIDEIDLSKSNIANSIKRAYEYLGMDQPYRAEGVLDSLIALSIDTIANDSFQSLRMAIALKKELIREERLSQEQGLDKYMIVKYDPFLKIMWYSSGRKLWSFNEQSTQSFKVQLSLGIKRDNIESPQYFFRLYTRYDAANWIFYDKIHLISDDGANYMISAEYPEKQSEVHTSGISEWCDSPVNSEEILKFANANFIGIRFYGKYTREYQLSDDQLLGFKDIIQKYKFLQAQQ